MASGSRLPSLGICMTLDGLFCLEDAELDHMHSLRSTTPDPADERECRGPDSDSTNADVDADDPDDEPLLGPGGHLRFGV